MATIKFVNLYDDRWGNINVDVVYEKTEKRREMCRTYYDLKTIRQLPKTVQSFMESVPRIRIWNDPILKQTNHIFKKD